MPAKRATALLLCQCIILCFSLAGPSRASGEQAAAASSITVVFDDNYPPYVLRDADGAIRGILVDQWNLWQKKTGIAVTLVGMDWGKAQQFMAEGKADVIDTIFFTEDRAKLYDFTRPWATIEVPVFFHRNISGISDARSLLGFTVGVKEGDAAIDFLARNGITTIQRFASYEAIAQAAAKQQIRVFCIDGPPGRYFLYKLNLENEFRSTAPLYTGEFHRAVRKGNTELLRTVEEGFAKISAREYAAIERRWMGTPLAMRPEFFRYALYGSIAVVAAALALLLWIVTLRRLVSVRTLQLRTTLEAQRKSEMKYRELVQNANSIILNTDRRGTVSFLNEYGQGFFGYPEGELVGKSMVGTIVPEGEGTGWDLAKLIEELARSPETHQSGMRENMRRTGERVWIHWTNRAVRDESGGVREILWVGSDVSELHRAESALRESEARFRLLAENANDVIWTMDGGGRFTYVSPSVKKLRGYEPSEVLSQTMDEAVTPRSLAVLREALKSLHSLLAAGERSFNFAPIEVEQTRRDGSTVWTEVVVTPMLDETGRFRGLLGVSRDISERRQREEESRALEAQMLQAQKLESLGVLAGGIAHDFNNILMAILGNAELARAVLPAGSPALERVMGIDEASRRAAELCRQMLAYSGRGSFSVETIDLSRLVRGMAHMLEVSVSKKAVLHTVLPDGLPSISGDATQIRQIVMNLIINASEAIGDGEGEIRMRTGAMDCSAEYLQEGAQGETPPAGRYVFLEVEDTGCGMDGATRAKIFDPFFSTKFTGRGLGLAAVLGIVRGHGGAILVASEPGRGTTFRVLFPAAAKPPAPVDTATEAEPWKGSGTILLVDDEPAVRSVGKAMLEAIGFTVLSASDGREAVDVFRDRAEEIACVILDLTMPRMGGEEAFVELRRIRPGARIVISTGYSEEDTSGRFAGERPAAFIQKPYRLAELSQVLRELLSSPRKEAGSRGTPENRQSDFR